MREKVRDKGRLEHILQACNDLLTSKDKYKFEEIIPSSQNNFGTS